MVELVPPQFTRESSSHSGHERRRTDDDNARTEPYVHGRQAGSDNAAGNGCKRKRFKRH